MSVAASSVPLTAVGRRHWRKFLPMWLFPIAFFSGSFFPGFSKHAGAYFFLLWFPIMGLCFWSAGATYRQRLATLPQVFFWAAVVPLVIWCALIAAVFGLAFAARAV